MTTPGTSGVVLAGAAGVGKTRLAREALVAAQARGWVTRWVANQALDSGASVIKGTVQIRNLSFAAIDQDEYLTTSTDFVPIPDISVTFMLFGRKRSSIVAVFSAMSFGGALETVVVRALLDGKTAAVPAEVQFSGADDAAAKDHIARCHSYQFVFPRIRPGSHAVAMEFRSFSGEMAFVHRPSLVVAHR